jgi:RNA recognition motif-containing protein
MPSQFDKEKAQKKLAVILEKMHNDTDLTLLSEYRKLYKREISLFRRSWAAAWLFMYYDRQEGGKTQYREERPAPVTGDADNSLPEDETKRLFISIGKNRRLFPREIIALISSKTSAVREDIGSIRILDNYSFIQVRDTKADEIIQALHGLRFRGRTLTVNYAKPKSGADSSNDE